MFTFSLFISIGAVLGLSWAILDLKEKHAFLVIDSSLGVLLGGLVGSRAIFVAVHWSYYQEHLLEIPQVWAGGLSSTGALAGGFMAWLILAGLNRQNSAALADQFFPVLMLVAVAAWLGCWLEGIAYGPLAGGAGWGLPARDEWGIFAARFPTQLFGAVLTLGWFWLIETWGKRRKLLQGWVAAWGFWGLTVILTGLSFLRSDPVLYWQELRLDTWGGFSLVLVSLICIFLRWRLKER